MSAPPPSKPAVVSLMFTFTGWGLGWVAAAARGTDQAWVTPVGLWLALGFLVTSVALAAAGIYRIARSNGRLSGLPLAITALVLDLLGGGFVFMGLLWHRS